jgi:glycosyltransferase involved in cell wall biosynthesis
MPRKRLRILTWHLHGNYLYYLTQAPHEFYVVSRPGRPPGYAGRSGRLPWGDNVHDAPVERLKDMEFDCVLYQSRAHYLADRYELLTPAQQRLPGIYLEHDPPQEHPTNTPHPARDNGAMLVHVTAFNALMWDSGAAQTRVIEHGVMLPEEVAYTGERPRGIVVVNCLKRRGRRLGADVYGAARSEVPLDLVGMESGDVEGGLGEIPNLELPGFMARYRFFFNPIRYTSLGLAVVEAMMIGMPVVGLATTEMATVIRNGVNGYTDTSVPALVEAMKHLIAHPREAVRWGKGARRLAEERFNIRRFVSDWNDAFAEVTA